MDGKKSGAAKKTSLAGMIIGAISLTVLFGVILAKFFGEKGFTFSLETAFALVVVGASPALPFSPVFISILFDKIKEIHQSGQSGEGGKK